MRRLTLVSLIAVFAAMVLGAGYRVPPTGTGSGSGFPGLSGTTGTNETFNALMELDQFQAVSGQLTTKVYIDPIFGSDETGDGTYSNPYFSLYALKTRCLGKPFSRCVVKGEFPVFTHTLITVTYGAASTRHLQVGDIITYSTGTSQTAEVLGVYGNKIATEWRSGTGGYFDGDPGVTSTFTAGGSEVVGSVTAVQDSITGFPSAIIAAGDISGAVISLAGHPYSDGDGPFRWYSENDDATWSSGTITEATSEVYICSVVPGVSFRLQVGSPTCVGTDATFSSAGTGDNQIIAHGAHAAATNVGSYTDIQGCRDKDRLCSLMESESPSHPWTIAGGNQITTTARSYIVQGWQWGNYGAGYSTPTSNLFGVTAEALPADGDGSQTAWVGVQNGIIQNECNKAFTAQNGGKMVVLNVEVLGICNGANDRSVDDEVAGPGEYAHASAFTSTGVNGISPGSLSSVLWAIGGNVTHTMGSNVLSGALINPNNQGFLGILSDGTYISDGISGDACVGLTTLGTPCSSAFVVQPGGDLVMVGPHVILGGNAVSQHVFQETGAGTRTQLYGSSFDLNFSYSGGAIGKAFLFYGSGGQGAHKIFDANNITITADGKYNLIYGCPLTGTSAATSDSTIAVDMKSIVLDEWNSANNFVVFEPCGVGGYTGPDAVSRAIINVEGIWDPSDSPPACGGGPCFTFDFGSGIFSRQKGSCGASNTFLNDICTSTDSTGATPDADNINFWMVNSDDSGGVGVDGLQWATDDPLLRCADGTKECWLSDTLSLASVPISFRDYYDNSTVSCIPADVVGTQICGLTMTPTHVGAR